MTFKEKVIARFKEFFPSAEIVFASHDFSAGIQAEFGMAEIKSEGDRFLHRRVLFESHEDDVNDQRSAEDKALGYLEELEFYKEPAFVLVRLIDSGEYKCFESDTAKHRAILRFSLGYKV